MPFIDLRDTFKRFRVGRPPKGPVRDTMPFADFFRANPTAQTKTAYKPIPRNLRYFARTPYARRAINAIKNPVALLEWEIVTLPGVDPSPEIERQIEVARRCFESPNNDDDFRSLAEATMEDILAGAGAIEKQIGGDPNRPLWMWPVDGLSLQIYPGWSGSVNEARYCQSVGYGSYNGGAQGIRLRDDEIIYIRPNPSTSTPFGLGPLEVAFTSVSRQLGVGEFAANVASNARPSILMDMGKGAGDALPAFRAYWQSDIEGQGKMPIVSTDGGKVQRLYPDGDAALFLAYQEFLKTEIAIAFDLSPMNLGVERDVNRSTAEVSAERDRDHAIKPWATLLASHLTRGALHRGLGFWQLRLRFPGLDPSDALEEAKVYESEFKSNSVVPDEYRERRGLPPMDNQWGKMTFADMQIAISAARGAASVDDPDLQPGPTAVPVTRSPAKPAGRK